MEFNRIKAVPYKSLDMGTPLPGRKLHEGGPIWPDWDTRVKPRFCRYLSVPVDSRPAEVEGEYVEFPEEAVWMGPVCDHFGHQIVDFTPRMVSSLEKAKELHDPVFVLGVSPRIRATHGSDIRFSQLPEYFRQIVDWFGIDRRRVLFLTKPTTFGKLHVFPQPEIYGPAPPTAEYLEQLRERVRLNLPYRRRGNRLYVSRAGMNVGVFAGEKCIETALLAKGVWVMRPESMSLREQLSAYWDADLLIFTEGSAVHSLELLGPNLGRLHVLRRRPDRRISEASLKARCAEVNYHFWGRTVAGLTYDGKHIQDAVGITLIPYDELLQFFKSVDVDLSSVLDEATYRAAVESDVGIWMGLEKHRLSILNRIAAAEIDAAGRADILARSATTVAEGLSKAGLTDLARSTEVTLAL